MNLVAIWDKLVFEQMHPTTANDHYFMWLDALYYNQWPDGTILDRVNAQANLIAWASVSFCTESA